MLASTTLGRTVSIIFPTSLAQSNLHRTSCKAVFVDTDHVPGFDSRVGDLVQNEVEGKLAYQIVEALLRSGIEERQIGIMSLYRQQIKLLSHLLQDKKHIEILTADRSQGRDKDCVIISMVRSNDHGQVRYAPHVPRHHRA